MSFFGGFTGSSQRNSIRLGRDGAAEQLHDKYDTADATIGRGLNLSNSALNTAYGQGQRALTNSYGLGATATSRAGSQAISAINTAQRGTDARYARAQGAINTGQTQAHGAFNQGIRAVNQSRDQNLGYYDQSVGFYQPYYDQGTRANALYGAALGLNEYGGGQAQQAQPPGPSYRVARSLVYSGGTPAYEAELQALRERYGANYGDPSRPNVALDQAERELQQRHGVTLQSQQTRVPIQGGGGSGAPAAPSRAQAQDIYNNDPMFQAIADRNAGRTFNRYNALGMGDSGLSRAALNQTRLDNYGNWLDRLNQEGDQGFQAGNAMAGVRQNQAASEAAQAAQVANIYGQQAGVAADAGAARAGLFQDQAGQGAQYGTQRANVAMNTGNQLSSLYQNRGNALSDLSTRFGTNRANNYTNAYNQIGQNYVNRGNTLVNLITGSQSAIANTQGLAFQNALNLGGLAVKAFAGPGGGLI